MKTKKQSKLKAIYDVEFKSGVPGSRWTFDNSFYTLAEARDFVKRAHLSCNLRIVKRVGEVVR